MTVGFEYLDDNVEDRHFAGLKRSNRSCSDPPHLFMYGMILVVYVGIAICAYVNGLQPFDLISDEDYERAMQEISVRLFQCRYICVSFFFLAVLFLGLYFIVIRYFTKPAIYTTIILMFVLLITLFLVASIVTIVALICILMIEFVFFALAIYGFRRVGCQTMCSIVQDSCKAMACLPSSILIVIINYVLIGLLISFNLSVIFGLLTIGAESEEPTVTPLRTIKINPPGFVYVLLLCFVLISLWTILVVNNIKRMTLYGIFTSWYRTADKNLIPATNTLRILHTNLRYHLGTLTFGSSIFSVIPLICAIYNSWTDLYGKFKKRPITVICFLSILANATSNTFVVSANYGTNFYQSMKRSLRLLMKNPLKFAAIRLISGWVTILGFIIIPGLTVFFAFLFFYNTNTHQYLPEVSGISMSIIAGTSMYLTLIFLDTFYAATTAILFGFMEDLNHTQMQPENVLVEDISTTCG